MITRAGVYCATAMSIAAMGCANATDGYFSLGYGMKSTGRGGAAMGFTDDSFGGANDPASPSWVGSRIDVGATLFIPKRGASRSDSDGAFGSMEAGRDFNQASEGDRFVIPEFAISRELSERLAVGVSVYGNDGLDTNYPGSAFSGYCPQGPGTYNALCGQWRLGVNLTQGLIAPTLAWRIDSMQSIGIAPLIGVQVFKSYGLQAFAGMSNAADRVTNNGADSSYGYGARVGYMLRPSEGLPSSHEKNIVRRQSPGLTTTNQSSVVFTPLQNLFGIITPSGLHFERDHNGRPDIDPFEHRLLIHGLVREPKIYTMEDILRLPSVSRIHFIECGANTAVEWANVAVPTVQYTHGMLGCSEFTGVPVATLLDEAGFDRRRARYILAEGADAAGMTRTLPIDRALDDALVVYGQNGEMLRPENGYPLRMLVPGVQGISNVKWLRRLKIGDQPFETREETRQYTDFMPGGISRQYTWIQEAKSVITAPSGGQKLLGKGYYQITGLAWSGRGSVKRVDISLDGCRNWRSAALQRPVLPKALTRFRADWIWDGAPALLQSRAGGWIPMAMSAAYKFLKPALAANAALCLMAGASAAAGGDPLARFGTAAIPAQIASWNIDVRADGDGLPHFMSIHGKPDVTNRACMHDCAGEVKISSQLPDGFAQHPRGRARLRGGAPACIDMPRASAGTHANLIIRRTS